MKTQYFVAFVMQAPFPDEMQKRAAILEQNFESRNFLKICPPSIIIKAPFELDNGHEKRLVEIIQSCVSRVSEPVLIPNGIAIVPSISSDNHASVLMGYEDLVKHQAKALRIFIARDLQGHFKDECPVDQVNSMYCMLGAIPIRNQYSARVAIQLPTVSKIDHLALFARNEPGNWKEVHTFTF